VYVHVLTTLCRQRRRDELVQVQQGISEAFAASLVGQEVRRTGWQQAAGICRRTV